MARIERGKGRCPTPTRHRAGLLPDRGAANSKWRPRIRDESGARPLSSGRRDASVHGHQRNAPRYCHLAPPYIEKNAGLALRGCPRWSPARQWNRPRQAMRCGAGGGERFRADRARRPVDAGGRGAARRGGAPQARQGLVTSLRQPGRQEKPDCAECQLEQWREMLGGQPRCRFFDLSKNFQEHLIAQGVKGRISAVSSAARESTRNLPHTARPRRGRGDAREGSWARALGPHGIRVNANRARGDSGWVGLSGPAQHVERIALRASDPADVAAMGGCGAIRSARRLRHRLSPVVVDGGMALHNRSDPPRGHGRALASP